MTTGKQSPLALSVFLCFIVGTVGLAQLLRDTDTLGERATYSVTAQSPDSPLGD